MRCHLARVRRVYLGRPPGTPQIQPKTAFGKQKHGAHTRTHCATAHAQVCLRKYGCATAHTRKYACATAHARLCERARLRVRCAVPRLPAVLAPVCAHARAVYKCVRDCVSSRRRARRRARTPARARVHVCGTPVRARRTCLDPPRTTP